ncbi:hypothetical protein NDU88_000793 [Pleurodeles waltl]|uniref:Uncharacterized protein n=1 Tax=Pleurodeles waltl TaxID=8319 RepID=A0AAV7PAP7_PLEWA|nr:hypothetical protein NDU88_000793 [Pleurodeles waltl]
MQVRFHGQGQGITRGSFTRGVRPYSDGFKSDQGGFYHKCKDQGLEEIEVRGEKEALQAYVVLQRKARLNDASLACAWFGFPDIIAEGFDGTAIDIKGYVDTEIEFKGKLANIKLYVADKGVNALGWRDQAKLGIILNPRACEPVMMIEESNEMDGIVSKFPQVFTDVLGKLKNYSHKIKLKSGARPVVQMLRDVPIGVRDELKRILAGMVNDDVIEEIESSEWVSPIVLARKSDKS